MNKPKKILVAEDDATCRAIVVDIAEELGHVVIQAANGERALDILKDNSDIDLLITDINMPELNGKELVRILRADKVFKTLPILMISGVVKKSEILSIIEIGPLISFISKPIDRTELSQYISCLLHSKREAQLLPGHLPRPACGS